MRGTFEPGKTSHLFGENRDFISVFLLHLYIAIFKIDVIIGFTNKLTDTYVAFESGCLQMGI